MARSYENTGGAGGNTVPIPRWVVVSLGARCQLFHGVCLGVGFSFLEVLGLYEIEVIQHAYPDNTEQDVRPTKYEFQNNTAHAPNPLSFFCECAAIIHAAI